MLKANAFVGLVTRKNKAPYTEPTSATLAIDDENVFAGESVGLSCALCHANNDGSVVRVGAAGGIGSAIARKSAGFVAIVALHSDQSVFVSLVRLSSGNPYGCSCVL